MIKKLIICDYFVLGMAAMAAMAANEKESFL